MNQTYSAVLREDIHVRLCKHLHREDEQEDLCFATYVPSKGNSRDTAIITDLILPKKGERCVHGNVGFMPEYLERAVAVARERGEGLAFMHSHPYDGWQGMSQDDVTAETRMAPMVYSVTGFPLVGLTVGTDGAWSARFWIKSPTERRQYNRNWCQSVRVVGAGVAVTFNDYMVPPMLDEERQMRTISAWGQKSQEDISRLAVGIVGLGSVGSIVAEILARTGVRKFYLIDFDDVEEKNLDRLTGVFTSDIGMAKVTAIREAIMRSASAPDVEIVVCEYSVCEDRGYKVALDSDIVFSCVDRPWGRQALNFIAYAHCIPVIDGGILVRTNKDNTRILGADWKAHAVGVGKACLECLGQYKTENAILEKQGYLDDPAYIKGLKENRFFDARENVYAFSSHLASMEVLKFLSLVLSPGGIADGGQQMYHFTTATMDSDGLKICADNCYFSTITGRGDLTGVEVTGQHHAAEKSREQRRKNHSKQKCVFIKV